jgi:hypothetical protein
LPYLCSLNFSGKSALEIVEGIASGSLKKNGSSLRNLSAQPTPRSKVGNAPQITLNKKEQNRSKN